MSCLNLGGYTRSECDNSIGGLEQVVLFEHSDIEDYSITGLTITSLDLTESGTPFTYEFQRDNANYADPIIGGELNSAWQPTLNMTFRKTSKEILNEVYELSKDYTGAIVKDNNGEYWMLGLERGLGLIASAGASSGNIFEDPNNVIIGLQGKERKPIQSIDISAGSNVDAKILALFGF